jgi:hypothetical protein
MKNTIKSIAITLFLFISPIIFAQDPTPVDPGVDPGIAPINDFIIPMLVLGITLGFVLFKKKKTA